MSRLIRVQMTTAHPGITWKKRNLFAASAAIGILLLFGFVQRIPRSPSPMKTGSGRLWETSKGYWWVAGWPCHKRSDRREARCSKPLPFRSRPIGLTTRMHYQELAGQRRPLVFLVPMVPEHLPTYEFTGGATWRN